MKRYVCAVWDSASGAYGQPFFVPAIGQALRSFTDEVRRVAPDNQLNLHPEDFTLHVLATFDDERGMFETDADTFRVLVRGKDVSQGGE